LHYKRVKIDKSYLCHVKRKFDQLLTENKLCTREDSILLAVSGGVDSMVMLHLFHQAGYRISVAHCNFQLRGQESDLDEELVKQVSSELKVACYSKRFDSDLYAQKIKQSIQMAARELRYDWFRKLMKEHEIKFLATAHHLNDNLETTLLNFVRGTGLHGLAGIPEKSNEIIRPLLRFTRDEIESFASEQNLKWRTDETNNSDDYDRNYIRHHLIPLLKELNPAIESGFDRTNERVVGALEIFDHAIDQLKKQGVKEEGDRLIVDQSLLFTLRHPQVLLWELIKPFGFNYTQCCNATNSAGAIGKIFLSATHQLTIDRHSLIVTRLSEVDGPVTIQSNDTQIFRDQLRMEISCGPATQIQDDPWSVQLDVDKLKFPLTWRKWQEGDYFYPLGLNHRKKLSDFLIDNKVALPDKSHISVVESDGEVIWVPGQRIDDRFKITSETRQTLRLQVHPHFD